MIEHEALFPPEPPTELNVCVGGVERALHDTDTTVYRWVRHPELDHAYHTYRDDEGSERQIAMFGHTALLDLLEGLGFHTVKNGKITDWDVQAYLEWQRQVLESELDEL